MDSDGPFDVLSGFGNEESLNVRLQLQFRSRIDRQTTVISVRLTSFNGDQQQLETRKTQPIATRADKHVRLIAVNQLLLYTRYRAYALCLPSAAHRFRFRQTHTMDRR